MAKNQWLEFIAEYKLQYPKMKYADLLAQAADSPEWEKFKKTKKKSIFVPKVNESKLEPVEEKQENNYYILLKKEIELLREELKNYKQQ